MLGVKVFDVEDRVESRDGDGELEDDTAEVDVGEMALRTSSNVALRKSANWPAGKVKVF